MTEETYTKPGKTARDIAKRARKARLAASQVTPRDVLAARRKARLRDKRAQASAQLPDGTSPALRAKLMAAQRHHETDPIVQATLARAKLSKRVQMAKEEAGISSIGEPPKFVGLDAVELEREMASVVPPPIATYRTKKAKAADKA